MYIPHFISNVGNIVKNGSFETTVYDEVKDELNPKYWSPKGFIGGAMVDDSIHGDYAVKGSYTGLSYFLCIPLYPGKWTVYAQVKKTIPEETYVGKFIMHCYDNNHSVSYPNESFEQNFVVSDLWQDVIFQFTAPDYTRLLHFSLRSAEQEKHIIFDNTKLARGHKTIEEMRKVKTILPRYNILNKQDQPY